MNWTNFLLTLTLLYLSYYGINLLYDMLRARKPLKDVSADELLFFDQETNPQLIIPNQEPLEDYDGSSDQVIDIDLDEPKLETADRYVNASSNLIHSTGAVGLKELFNLAKDNLIEYTGAISY